MRFCTYMYMRRDVTPYYVGKGTESRPFDTCHVTPRPKERSRIFVQFWSSEKEAFDMEKFYIRLFGRKDNGTGILRNLTDGGDGSTGYRHTDAARLSMSITRTGKKMPPFSQEHREHMRVSGRRKTGNKNPMFGKKRPDLSAFMLSYWAPERKAEAKKRITDFGTPESRINGGRSTGHIRWHIKRGIINADCVLCSRGAGL